MSDIGHVVHRRYRVFGSVGTRVRLYGFGCTATRFISNSTAFTAAGI